MLHDVCIQNLSVVFALDRARTGRKRRGDSPGHFDLSYLSCIEHEHYGSENLWELGKELEFAVCHYGWTDCHPLSAGAGIPGIKGI